MKFVEGQKKFDKKAFFIIALVIVLMVALVFARQAVNQLRLDQRVFWIAGSPQSELWISLPDRLVVTDTLFKVQREYPLTDLGLVESPVNMIFVGDDIWLRSPTGDVYRCPSPRFQCQVLLTGTALNYWNLTAIPDNQGVALISNGTGEVILYDAQGQQIDQYRRYETSALNEVRQMTEGAATGQAASLSQPAERLYRANNAVFLDQQFVVANTGMQQLSAWTLDLKGLPDFKQLPKQILSMSYQPYFIAPYEQAWYVLGAGASLSDGRLYRHQDMRVDELPLPLNDPNSMTKVGRDLLVVSDMARPALAFMSMSMPEPKAAALVASPTLSPIFRQVEQTARWFQYIGWFLLGMVMVLPISAVLYLKKQGYNLNQSL